jgi:ligand-binding sensor protein
LDGSWKKEDIHKMAQAMPPLAKAAGPLSKDEQDLIGYHEMPAGTRRSICRPKDEDEPVISHPFVNEDMVRDVGAWELMVEAQVILLKKEEEDDDEDEEEEDDEDEDEEEKLDKLEFEEEMNKVRSKENKKNCQRAITIGSAAWSGQHKVAPPKFIDIASQTLFGEQPARVNTLVADASQRILRRYLDPSYIGIYERQFAIDCVLSFGHHDNLFTSTAQINYSSPSHGDLQKELSSFGGLHVDHTDAPARYTCLLFLSHLPDNTFPGRFCLPLQREYCEPVPFTALIFKGTHPHLGLPPLPFEPA